MNDVISHARDIDVFTSYFLDKLCLKRYLNLVVGKMVKLDPVGN